MLFDYTSKEASKVASKVASTASVATLAIFYIFRPLSRKCKNTCWDIPNPYEKDGGIGCGKPEKANHFTLPGNGRRKKTH